MTPSSLTAPGVGTVVTSYGPFHGFTLHSLTTPVALDCALCRQTQQLVFVATCGNSITCPRCYAHTVARTATQDPLRVERYGTVHLTNDHSPVCVMFPGAPGHHAGHGMATRTLC